jgi:nucleoside-diphosphate-sugar epimerase
LSGRKYNITNGQPILVGDLLTMAFSRLGLPFAPWRVPYPVASAAAAVLEFLSDRGLKRGEPKLTRYTAGVFNFHQTLDISRARRELGYAPKVSLEAGIDKYAEWRLSHEA